MKRLYEITTKYYGMAENEEAAQDIIPKHGAQFTSKDAYGHLVTRSGAIWTPDDKTCGQVLKTDDHS